MKKIIYLLVLFFTGTSFCQSVFSVNGFCIAAPAKEKVDEFVGFIEKELVPGGINTLILRVDFNYAYESRPELRDDNPLTKEDVKKIVAVSKKNNINLIPQVNLLGHQSWAGELNKLLEVYPEFDETPHVKIPEKYEWPNADGLYCKSYCPRHPKVHDVVFDLMDESGVNFVHKENEFDDFEKETLLPHRMSQLGPALTVADVNGDGLEDFFIGGAKGSSSALYLQNTSGKFSKSSKLFASDKNYEDVGAVFFDADNDGDQDLYVISGGSENEPNNYYYTDRLYENKGQGNFIKNTKALPEITSSGLRVSPADFDNDGDIDLFVGGRIKPGFYGRPVKSYLLENTSSNGVISFKDVTKTVIPEMLKHTMVTASVWADIDKDGNNDLLIANEWGSIELYMYEAGAFKNKSKEYGLSEHVGWWSSIDVNDIDNDGDLDIVAGNLGLNYKYKASSDKPFYMFINDFDENNTDDIVLGYSQENKVFPVRGRQCTSGQMPFVKDKFKTYNSYGSASVDDIYGDKLNEGESYKATYFASAIIKNEGDTFKFQAFENNAQLSSVNKILIGDFNKDATKDILLLGNLYGSEVETPRNDASYGTLLIGNGLNDYTILNNSKTNLWANGDIKDAAFITIGNTKAILLARNNDKLSIIKINN